jgi:hypothetical protein
MSYDLDLFAVPSGYTFDQAFDALDEGKLPKSDLSVEDQLKQNYEIVKELLTQNPKLAISSQKVALVVQNEKELDRTSLAYFANVELRSDEGINIYIFTDQASVTVPYWYIGEEAHQVFQTILGLTQRSQRKAQMIDSRHE